MKKKLVNVFFVFILCVLAILHSAFVGAEKESNIQLREVEMLSTSEGSWGNCNAVGGWCFTSEKPQEGMHTL